MEATKKLVVHRFMLPYTDINIYEQEDGTHRATLNGVLLPEKFTGTIDEIKQCCLNILFAQYASVLKIIEKSVIGEVHEKAKCENDLCKECGEGTVDVSIQPEAGHQLKINK